MNALKLDRVGIQEYQKNRDPYLMIDYAEEVVPGVSARGYKDLSVDEWYFKVHWPGDPNMPGMLQLEALIQMCALTVLTLPGNKGKLVYVLEANKIRFREKVVPGSRLEIETELTSWKRGLGKCYGMGKIDGKTACQAEFTIGMPDIFSGYKVVE